MVRTKKHFRPPSPSSSSSSSEEEDDDHQQQMVMRGRGKQLMSNFGRGKQLSMPPPGGGMAGRGKQLRAPEPESEEEESSDDDSSSEEEEAEALPPPPSSLGKQLRSMGRGKQLRAPSPPPQQLHQQDDESESSEEDETPTHQPPPAAVARGGGKHFGVKMIGTRGMGKQLHRDSMLETNEEQDSDSSSSDEEPWAAPRGQGKQLRPSPTTKADKEESDMEESSEEEEEEDEKREPELELEPTKLPALPPTSMNEPEQELESEKNEHDKEDPDENGMEEQMEEEVVEQEDSESEFESDKPDEPLSRRGRPPRAAAKKAAESARATANKEISSEEESEEEEEEEEKEEASSSESESSSDEEMELDVETYDMRKLVKGSEDRKHLDSLTELERENILAERFEKLKSEADMKKALRENKRREREQKKEARKKKLTKKRSPPTKSNKALPAKKKAAKKVESEEEEDEEEGAPDTSGDVALAQSLSGKRVSARNLDKKGKQFKKQAALAKIRENRANKVAAVEESDSDYGRDSDDSDDDYEDELKPWQQKGKKNPHLAESSDDESMGAEDDQQTPSQGERRTEDTEGELEDYIKVSIPRRRLMRWCNEPFFDQAVKNFYVRLAIGRDNKTQKACYRLCRITGVVAKSEYSFPSIDNRKPVSTDKWLKLSFGKFVKEFNMITVSDHRPSADDVTKLVGQLKTERQTDSLLTKKAANKLRKRQDELVNNYTYTKEDIDMLVKEKKKRNKKPLNIGLEITRIAIAVQAAKDEVGEATKRLEDAKVERIEADDDVAAIAESSVTKAKEALEMSMEKLKEKIEEQQSIHKDELDRRNRLKQSSKVQNWVKVNQRAKMANRNADFQSYKEQQAKEKTQGSAEPKFDPYARRRVKPKNLWEVGGSKQSGDKSFEVAGIEEKKEISPSERDDSNAGKENSDRASNRRDDFPETQKMELLGQANSQFAFDDDIIIGDIASLGRMGVKKKPRTKSRKGISLDEYREWKAAGTL